MTRSEAIDLLICQPYKLGHMVGLTKLRPIHNRWIRDMILGKEDKTLQAHRGSYKTTCVSIALSCILILFPVKRVLFMRKTDADVKEVVRQVSKILKDDHTRYIVQTIYGSDLILTTETMTEISTNLSHDVRGTEQLTAIGTGGSITGKHYDAIFTDDIVNLQDRISRAERERTKTVYQEIQNIINRPGRIYNTGTPWHKDDAFSIMPEAEKVNCYTSGLMSAAEIEAKKAGMTRSLFAANYELRHVAAEDVLFSDPVIGGDPAKAEQGITHIDASYGGADGTAFCICRKVVEEIRTAAGEKELRTRYYVLGKLRQKHVDDCLDELIAIHGQMNAGRWYLEDNADKGYLAKTLKKRGQLVTDYHEAENKYVKISSFIKPVWKDIVFVNGTDPEYIDQICDYSEHADHDDAPDNLASIIRILQNDKKIKVGDKSALGLR